QGGSIGMAQIHWRTRCLLMAVGLQSRILPAGTIPLTQLRLSSLSPGQSLRNRRPTIRFAARPKGRASQRDRTAPVGARENGANLPPLPAGGGGGGGGG